ncbi:bacteriocin [Aestuariibacter sp. GS-14]|uniref:bacteriocin n=1 Tax=Alteromonadaceae TaxID=72275 RepID=UPI001127CC82|nr:bacteriocin [Aestuariibacter sp. GS-14]TPV62024.1 bacteriocin [Aestuariibacter sp. GS-14]
MTELNEKELTQVNGGFGSLIYWGIRGGIYLYRTYSATQIATGAGFAAGAGITIAAEMDD